MEGEPRWLTTIDNKMHSLIVVIVKVETITLSIKMPGLLFGGMLLKVVNYQSSKTKSQCRNYLYCGHHNTFCNRLANALTVQEHILLQTTHAARGNPFNHASIHPRNAYFAIQQIIRLLSEITDVFKVLS